MSPCPDTYSAYPSLRAWQILRASQFTDTTTVTEVCWDRRQAPTDSRSMYADQYARCPGCKITSSQRPKHNVSDAHLAGEAGFEPAAQAPEACAPSWPGFGRGFMPPVPAHPDFHIASPTNFILPSSLNLFSELGRLQARQYAAKWRNPGCPQLLRDSEANAVKRWRLPSRCCIASRCLNIRCRTLRLRSLASWHHPSPSSLRKR